MINFLAFNLQAFWKMWLVGAIASAINNRIVACAAVELKGMHF